MRYTLLILISFLIFLTKANESNAQAAFLARDKTWITENLENSWQYQERGKSKDGRIFITYERGSIKMAFYFDQNNICNEILVLTNKSRKDELIKYYDSIYEKVRELRWVSIKDNAIIEMLDNQETQGIIGVRFKLSL